MSDFNSQHNRAVWFDIPTIDLERAASFYRAVLGIQMHREQFQDSAFYVLDHAGGNGGCLVTSPPEVGAGGVLVYLNVDGRIARRSNRPGSAAGKFSSRSIRSARMASAPSCWIARATGSRCILSATPDIRDY